MRRKLLDKIAKWLIQHSDAGMAYVIEMRNEVATSYEWEIAQLEKEIECLKMTIERMKKKTK